MEDDVFGQGEKVFRNGEIASVSLRSKGQRKATRLLSLASLREFMEAHTIPAKGSAVSD